MAIPVGKWRIRGDGDCNLSTNQNHFIWKNQMSAAEVIELKFSSKKSFEDTIEVERAERLDASDFCGARGERQSANQR